MAMMACATIQPQSVPQWPEVTNEMKAGSRWWWMGSAVDEENLRWNMEQYAKAGIGTLEISPIYGVKGNASKNIAFLSEKWIGMLKYATEQGQTLGIDVDMITGTGWPFGGPMVSAAESASKLGTMEATVTGDGSTAQTITLTGSGTLQRVLAFPKSGNTGEMTDLTSMVQSGKVTWTAPEGGWRIIAVYCQSGAMQVKRPSPGFDGLVLDHFDAKAVQNYLTYFDNKFAKVPGVWPRSFFNDSYEIGAADWTRNMFEEFEKYRGYKLETVMDKLIDKNAQVMADYRQTLSDMLLHNFTEQWTAWAHSHGVTTRNQAHGSPGNLIDLYAAADIPEIESFYLSNFGIKGLRKDDGFTMQALSTLPTLKYASSAAHITGKPLVSSESMTWLTEHFRSSLSQMKPELDQLFVAGVNHVLFHGTTYSPQQAAWPGWKFYAAIDMSPTNSIWKDAPSMMKYIERVQSFMQMGQPDNDLLVYAPFAYAMHQNLDSRMLQFDINYMDTKMADLAKCVNAIHAAGLDCDYTSEQYLMKTTCVDGQLQTVGGVRYQALVVPVTTNLPDSVQTHLNTLAEQGAKIVYDYSPATLQGLGIKGEPMRGEHGLKMIRRKNDTGHHYFVANLSTDDVEGYVPLAVNFASAVLFDPVTGSIRNAVAENGEVYISLKSGQSIIIQTYTTGGVSAEEDALVAKALPSIELGGNWTLHFSSDSYPAITGTYALTDGVKTWEELDAQTAQLMGTGIYTKTFTLTAEQVAAATGGWNIDLGDVRESARVRVNGTDLGCAWSVPYVVACPASVLKAGENTIEIEVTNLPANRIRQMDIDGTVWRIFEDTNINTISNSTTYTNWALVPSGLNSQVKLVPLVQIEKVLDAEFVGFVADENESGTYYQQYQVAVPGQEITALSVVEASGNSYSGYSSVLNADGTATLTLRGVAGQGVQVTATTAGGDFQTLLPAYGAYSLSKIYDFTSESAPESGWGGKTSGVVDGFDLKGYRTAKKTTPLYTGLTFTASASNYVLRLAPGYGLNLSMDARLDVAADDYSIGVLSYLVGNSDNSCIYNAADSLVTYNMPQPGEAMGFDMKARSSYYLYRMLCVYVPKNAPTSIAELRTDALRGDDDDFYTLQGIRVRHPQAGIYIHRGRKVLIK